LYVSFSFSFFFSFFFFISFSLSLYFSFFLFFYFFVAPASQAWTLDVLLTHGDGAQGNIRPSAPHQHTLQDRQPVPLSIHHTPIAVSFSFFNGDR